VAVFPLFWSLYLSFTKFSVIKDQNGPTWIGLGNFDRLLSDPDIWQRFTTTARFVIPAVTIELLFGFSLAMLLNRAFKGRGMIVTLIADPDDAHAPCGGPLLALYVSARLGRDQLLDTRYFPAAQGASGQQTLM